MNPIRVLIADDMPQVRQDLRTLLPLAGNIEIAGEAANGHEAIEQAASLQPDVILKDLEMPVVDGSAATRSIKLRHPATRIIALTIHTDAATRQTADRAGVDVFIEKGAPLGTLLQAIQVREE